MPVVEMEKTQQSKTNTYSVIALTYSGSFWVNIILKMATCVTRYLNMSIITFKTGSLPQQCNEALKYLKATANFFLVQVQNVFFSLMFFNMESHTVCTQSLNKTGTECSVME